jgi:hypothetical protein
MKRKLLVTSAIGCLALAIFALAFVYAGRGPELIGEDEENEMYDGPEQAAQLNYVQTMDIKLGRVPMERLLPAINAAAESKAEAARQQLGDLSAGRKPGSKTFTAPDAPSVLSWVERGPNSDSVGPSNGNSRANSGITAGRIRAVLVDANDPSGNTVFVAGVDGGLWKTTDISVAAPVWTPINDFLGSLAISDIVQDPRPGFTNIMYFGTGEGFRNADAVRGIGIFKSIDGGATWSYLPSTSSFLYTTRLVVDSAGNVYAGTRVSGGLQRSTDGGATWTNITPSGVPSVDVCDLELSSTGRLHAVFGIIATNSYRFTDTPSTVTAGAGWTSATTAFTASPVRTEIAVSSDGNTLYAAPSDAGYQVPTIFKSVNGGVDWAPTTTQPTSGWASQQAWYSLSMVVNPADPNQVIVGGLDNYLSITGGAVWTKISAWVGTVGQYAHADQHKAVWYAGGTKLLMANDGGIFYSTDGGVTIRDRNTGLRIKQFYSVAMRPEANNNYLLAGAQDNGTHALSGPGLGASVEVTGGDGAFVAINQANPNNMFGAYVYNQYRFSTNGGTSWSQRNFSSTAGRFINPFEIDPVDNILYAADVSGSFRRWPVNPPTTAGVSTVLAVSNMAAIVSAVSVSPYTPHRVLLATGPNPTTGSTAGAGKVFLVDNADTFATGSAAVDISSGLPAGTNISNVAFGTTDNNLIASVSNFGQQHVWISSNGGTSWTSVSGNLPDIPVRWAMYKPGTNTGAIIGTELGVWETTNLNGAATAWVADPTFPSVRVDMIRYRPSDGLLAAGTHGRGVWTTAIPTAANVSLSGRVFSADGERGLTNAHVVLTSPDGTSREVITGRLGSFRFDNVPAGATYTISVNAKRFIFVPQTISVSDSIADLNFFPTPSGRDF